MNKSLKGSNGMNGQVLIPESVLNETGFDTKKNRVPHILSDAMMMSGRVETSNPSFVSMPSNFFLFPTSFFKMRKRESMKSFPRLFAIFSDMANSAKMF